MTIRDEKQSTFSYPKAENTNPQNGLGLIYRSQKALFKFAKKREI